MTDSLMADRLIEAQAIASCMFHRYDCTSSPDHPGMCGCGLEQLNRALTLPGDFLSSPPPAVTSQSVGREADYVSILSHHRLGGPWAQYRQEMPFAADCGCGEMFFAKTEGDARAAWTAHVAHYLALSQPASPLPAVEQEAVAPQQAAGWPRMANKLLRAD